MSWQLLVAINIILVAVSSLLQKKFMSNKKINPIAYAAGFQILMSLVVGVVVLFKGMHFPNLAPIAINLIMMPFLYSLGNISRFNAFKKIGASEFTVIFQMSTVIAVIISVTFLGEAFNYIKIFGLSLILLAVILVTIKDKVNFKFNNGEIWTFICAAAYGIAFVNDAYILRSFELWTYIFFSFLTPGLLTLLYLGKDFKSLKDLFSKESRIGIFASSFSFAIAIIAIYAAYQIGRNFAQISSITPTSSILIVVFAAVFLKERDHIPRKIIAVILAIIGIILLR